MKKFFNDNITAVVVIVAIVAIAALVMAIINKKQLKLQQIESPVVAEEPVTE